MKHGTVENKLVALVQSRRIIFWAEALGKPSSGSSGNPACRLRFSRLSTSMSASGSSSSPDSSSTGVINGYYESDRWLQ